MKTIIALFISIIWVFQIYGTEVTLEQARKVAESFLQNNSSQGLKSTPLFELKDAGDIFNENFYSNSFLKSATVDKRTIYIFNIGAKEGFIIVSGDDAAIPILGYSNSGAIDPETTPPNALNWLEGYQQQVQYIRENNIEPTELIKNLWNDIPGTLKSTQRSVLPLISTKWNQSPFENAFCPYDPIVNKFSYAGCVATAMAQIMKFWEYPAKGTGSHSYQLTKFGTLSANFGATTYDWDAMPDRIDGPNDAVATLMYHCGVATEMIYGVDSSSTYVLRNACIRENQTVEYALPTYFGYATTIYGIRRADYLDDDLWKNILEAELDHGRPIQYAGHGKGGHSFVCDGYDENEYFHINWGWGGHYDGYFLLDALNPADRSYNNYQEALIGIQPGEAPPKNGLELYSDVKTNKSIIEYKQGFTISTNIVNTDPNDFNGDYCAAVFDKDNTFVDYVDIISGWNLPSGHHYTYGLNFTTQGMPLLFPGSYTINIYSRPTVNSWNKAPWNRVTADASDSLMIDHTEIEVVNNNNIYLDSGIKLLTNTIYTHDSLAVWLNIANKASTEFKGILDVSLFNLKGELVASVERKTNLSLPAGTHYEGGLTFSTKDIAAEPGTYLLLVRHLPEGRTYFELTGSNAAYLNPIKIIVKETLIEKDIYENNDRMTDAYSFIPSYENDYFNIRTTGANIHVGNDVDFYAVHLDGGYHYDITTELIDSKAPDAPPGTPGVIRYSLHGLYQSSLDGVKWSPISSYPVISTSGNKTFFCAVMPYYAGERGTYLLHIKIKRTMETPNEKEYATTFSIYPNPCKQLLTISGSDQILSYSLFDIYGKLRLTKKGTDHRQTINTSGLSSGTYFIQVKTRDKTYVEKIIKE